MKVEGVDRVVLDRIEEKTTKPVVQETERVRIEAEEQRERQRQRPAGDFRQELERSVRQLNQTSDIFNIRLRFKLDEDTGEIYVLVIDREEGRIIRRIPPDNILKTASQMQEMVGLLLDELV
ncbi:MAG: flagellar protein FlaG [Clostridia bacterium]|nr:MAG: flagellar protein FlaG [Clostridia bacterium]